jgi:hypothetical protein
MLLLENEGNQMSEVSKASNDQVTTVGASDRPTHLTLKQDQYRLQRFFSNLLI